jgi:hypothetical protein
MKFSQNTLQLGAESVHAGDVTLVGHCPFRVHLHRALGTLKIFRTLMHL